MKRITIASINKAFEDRGVDERLARGKDHFFFHSGSADTWSKTCVFVNKVSSMDVQGWFREHSRLRGLHAPCLFPDHAAYVAKIRKWG